MMNYNKAPVEEVVSNESGLVNGKECDQLSAESEHSNRRFGVMDLWSIRRSARKFKIHDRISRL